MDIKLKTLFSNTLLFTLGNIGSKFIMFFLLPLYTHTLTTEQYGITELIITASNLLIPFISLSIQDSVLRFALDKENEKGQVLKNACVVMLGGTILLFCMSPLLKLYNPIEEWSIYFIIITLLHMYRIVFSLYIKAVGKTRLFAVDSILYTLFLAISNILFLLVFKMGIIGYFLAMISATAFSAIFLFISGNLIRDIRKSYINITLLKQMLIFSIPMIINAVSWWIANSSDRIMLQYFIGANAVGLYSVAAKMPSLLTSVTSIFNQAWVISAVTEYDSTRDKEFYEKTFSIYNFLLVIFASVIIFIIKPFMQIYVGNNFIESWQYVPYLLLGAIFLTYASFFGAIYTSAKKNVNVMVTTLIGAILNIILNLVLIPYLGILGAAIATMIAYLVIGIYRMFNSRRYFKFYIDYKIVFLSLIVLVVQSVFVSLDIYSIVVSLVSLMLISLINSSNIIKCIRLFKQIIKNTIRKRKSGGK